MALNRAVIYLNETLIYMELFLKMSTQTPVKTFEKRPAASFEV